MIVLHEIGINTRRRKFLNLPCLLKEPAAVAKHLRLD